MYNIFMVPSVVQVSVKREKTEILNETEIILKKFFHGDPLMFCLFIFILHVGASLANLKPCFVTSLGIQREVLLISLSLS